MENVIDCFSFSQHVVTATARDQPGGHAVRLPDNVRIVEAA
jgi:hypothetical protein